METLYWLRKAKKEGLSIKEHRTVGFSIRPPQRSLRVRGGGRRRVLAYCQDLMCVENTFEKGACGALHHDPAYADHLRRQRQIGGFEIDGEKRVVTAGDTMLKMNGVTHGCVCLEAGVLLDIFTPMREDFVQIIRK